MLKKIMKFGHKLFFFRAFGVQYVRTAVECTCLREENGKCKQFHNHEEICKHEEFHKHDKFNKHE